jgi:hypothetical protein
MTRKRKLRDPSIIARLLQALVRRLLGERTAAEPPDIWTLAERFGGLSRIPIDQLQRHDRAMRKWRRR